MNIKLKYYLRGMGAGIIIATIVLMVAYNIHSKSLKRNDVNETTTLKPIYGTEKNTTESLEKNTTEESTESQTEIQSQTEAVTDSALEVNEEITIPDVEQTQPEEIEPQTEAVSKDEVTLSIPGDLDSSQAIATYLYENGIVANASDFNIFLETNGYDKSLHTGTKTFPYNADYEKIAEILTR